ncbi:MAG: hydrogenase maturation nickel metallochaperone HypA [Gemmataceae bacterium]|nr:hydrogenase maturation nickel metallochaperone HypA [Gemmataceae bacterium]MDW8267487.1 hydrogenase maturation nickel metallochaperone HypA [Gemmataceae bacterium]
MHELSVMQEILTIASEHAQAHGARQICRLTLRVGELSGVCPDALRLAFAAAAGGTPTAAAELLIDSVPVRCWCAHCQREFAPSTSFYECPDCGQLSADVRQGWELEIAQLEIV